MKMDQVAIAYRTEEEKAAIKASLGLADKEWIKDVVSADVRVLGRHGDIVNSKNVAELEFCMVLGMQFELIRYVEGPNWIDTASRLGTDLPMVAHVGFHLDEGEEWPDFAGVLVQEAWTTAHTNEAVNKADRRYQYRIYRVGSAYFKFIKRLTKKTAQDPLVDIVEDVKPQPAPEKEKPAKASKSKS